MRLVFVTQAIDSDDPNLAVAVDWVRALAARCDEVRVIADRVRTHDLPANVNFGTFGSGSRVGRGVRYERAVVEALHEPRPDAMLVHMVPLFLMLAAPVARVRRVPLLLWYTHWRGDWTLRVADRLCAAALSVDRASYPLESSKLHAIGHGIDVSRFAGRNGSHAAGGTLRLVALGRTAPWKGYRTLLDGFELAVSQGLDARLEIRGPSLKQEERRHRAELADRIARSPALAARVQLSEPVPREQIPRLLAASDALVTAADSGRGTQTLDKVVYEASACAVPVIASNPALAAYLDGLPLQLGFRSGDASDLARALVEFAAAPPELREATGLELRRRVEHGHSVDTWADRVLAVVEEVPPVTEQPDVSIVVTVLNEEGAIDELLDRTGAALDGRVWEVIVVDDGSTDGTFERLRAAHRRDPRVHGVRFKRNFGQHPAMHAGLARSRGELIVTMDGDLQNEPEDLPKLLAALARADVASGRRVARSDSPGRTVPSRVINGLLRRFTGVRISDFGCAYNGYRREAILPLLGAIGRQKFTKALVLSTGVSVEEVDVSHAPARSGSRYSPFRLVRLALHVVAGFWPQPVQWIGVTLGVVCTVAAAALGVYGVAYWIANANFPGPLFAGAGIVAVLGVQGFVLALIGESLGRIQRDVEGRPLYTIEEEL